MKKLTPTQLVNKIAALITDDEFTKAEQLITEAIKQGFEAATEMVVTDAFGSKDALLLKYESAEEYLKTLNTK